MTPGSILGDNPEMWLLLAAPLGLFLLFFIFMTGDGARRQMTRRIDLIKKGHGEKPTPVQIISARRATNSGPLPGLEALIKKLVPRQEMLRLRLTRAGMEVSLGVYGIVCLIIGFIGMTAAAIAGLPLASAALSGVFLGLGLPHYYVGSRFKKRQTRFITHFPDAIDLMVRGVKAGLPITESIKAASEEIPDPVSTELKRIIDGIRVGRKINDLLAETCKRLNLPEFNFFAIALSIQTETGGNLAETLNNLAEVLRGRRQLKRKIKALSSEAKASAYIIGSLPFIMCLLIWFMNPDYIEGLFMDPRGQVMIGGALAMIGLGAIVMSKMTKFEI
ncbi:MAG: type II secretion system F family protein [Proteobacteria bacterium]|nr:type II secretion system F family protein [Pseudomonadota bacterium]